MKTKQVKSTRGYRPLIKIFVVYKTQDNTWRGFCSPYDVTYETVAKKEAMIKLEKLVKLYEKGLQKYNYPKHLSLRPLSEQEDQVVFEKVKRKIFYEIEQEFLQFLQFQAERKRRKRIFEIEDEMKPSGYYLCSAQYV